MRNTNKRILRRVTITNRFDRACNFIVTRMFPLDRESSHCVALEYASEKLKHEKMLLKELRHLIATKPHDELTTNNIAVTLRHIENEQYERHQTMHEIIRSNGKVR